MANTITRRTSLAALGALLASGAPALGAETPPPLIRLAGVGSGYGKPYGTQIIGVVRAGQFVEHELQGSGVRVEWQFPDRTGPAINEAFAGNQLDFAGYGQLPQIVARAAGLPTRILASTGVNTVYILVRNGVRAQSLADLKGLKITLQRGTILHSTLDRLLAQNHLSEADVQLYDLTTADQVNAMTAGEVDAVVGTTTVLDLRDQGIARILYTTRGKPNPDALGSLLVTEDFLHRYPQTTRTVVRAFIKAAHWLALEKNRSATFDMWVQSGRPRRSFLEDFSGLPLKTGNSPLIDDFFVAGYKSGVSFALAQRLIRKPVDVDAWIDRSYVDDALRSLDLAGFWPAQPALG